MSGNDTLPGFTKADLERAMNALDKNKDGSLSRQEVEGRSNIFQSQKRDLSTPASALATHAAEATLNSDTFDGLGPNIALSVPKSAAMKTALKQFNELDTNKDGKVTSNEMDVRTGKRPGRTL